MFEYIYKSIIRVKYLLFGRQFISVEYASSNGHSTIFYVSV